MTHAHTIGTMLACLALSQAVPGAATAEQASESWIPLFNGKDLTGWTPKFAGHPLGENLRETFRVEDGAIVVSYENWEQFDGAFGHLFHVEEHEHYRLRLEYRFTGEQVPGGPGWAFRNSGIMVHGQSAESMRVEQDFPVSIEVQLLGGDGAHERHTGNLCTPGTNVVMNDELVLRHCIDSTSKTYHGDDWIRAEIEVRGGRVIRHFIEGELVLEYEEPQLDRRDPDAERLVAERSGVTLLEGGTISLQAESHACAFRRIEILPLRSDAADPEPKPRAAPPSDGQASAARPNIVVFLADDLGYSDIGCFGGEIATPNLDRLADGGMRLTQFYNTGRCCPTRAALLTGLYPHEAGVGHMMNDRGSAGYRGDLNDRCLTLAEALGPAGYRTLMTGKWHVTKQLGAWSGDESLRSRHNWPLQRGFDRFWGTIHGAGSYWNPVSLTDGNTPIAIPEGEPFYYTDAISDAAARFVREHDGAEPLLLYVAYTAPHWPLHAWPEDIARYEGRYDEGWDALRAERFERMRSMGLLEEGWTLTARGDGIPDWPDAPHPAWQQRAMEVYAAMVDRMDQGIGRVLAALEETGRLDDTLVMFLADNGGCAEGGTAFDGPGGRGGLSRHMKVTRDGRPVEFGHYATTMPGPADTYQEYGRPWANASNTPFRLYKHWVHEGGIASPCIVHWPNGIAARGALSDEPAHVVDLMPTFLELAGATYPEMRDGVPLTPLAGASLLPAFAGAPLDREAIYWEHEGNRAVRRGDWKLVARGRQGAWELYDLAADRTETNDLAAVEPQLVAELAAMWTSWAERSNVLPWPN